MKYIICLLLFISICTQLNSQNEINENKVNYNFGNNELKINALFIPWGYPEISYERIFRNTNSGIGLSIGKSFSDLVFVDFSVIPYFRWYFGKKKGAGFFLEGNTVYFNEISTSTWQDPITRQVFSSTDEKGWLGELVIGAGRILNDYAEGGNRLSHDYPRIAISLGKRF